MKEPQDITSIPDHKAIINAITDDLMKTLARGLADKLGPDLDVYPKAFVDMLLSIAITFTINICESVHQKFGSMYEHGAHPLALMETLYQRVKFHYTSN